MQTKPKSNSIITTRMVDGNPEFTVRGFPPFIVDVAKISAANRARAMMHGLVQRISDGGALSRNPETGLPATPEDKRNRMLRIAEHLMSGADQWELRVAAGPRDDAGLTVMGIMRAMGKTADEVESILVKTQTAKGVDRKAALTLWASTKDVSAAIQSIKAERAAAANRVDAADLLDQIMGGDVGDEVDDGADGEAAE